jgi:hypothetical protein
MKFRLAAAIPLRSSGMKWPVPDDTLKVVTRVEQRRPA